MGQQTRRDSPWQVLLGVAVVLLALPLLFRMDPAHFTPFLKESTWRFLALGMAATLLVSAIALVASVPLALAWALARRDGPRWLRWPTIGLVEGLRAVPLLGIMYLLFFRLSAAGEATGWTWLALPAVAVCTALWLYTGAVNAETLRAAMQSLPAGQWEAARAIGLSYPQAMRRIILPQATRTALPALAAQSTTLVKDSSLGFIIGFLELYKRGVILYQGNHNPLETIYVVVVLYFVVNFTLGRIVDRLGERVSGKGPLVQGERSRAT